jgi:hypothetical protein
VVIVGPGVDTVSVVPDTVVVTAGPSTMVVVVGPGTVRRVVVAGAATVSPGAPERLIVSPLTVTVEVGLVTVKPRIVSVTIRASPAPLRSEVVHSTL